MDALKKYLNTFKKLRIDKAHGIAPHKPILLISVLQGFYNNLITTPKVYITPELVALFKANWSLLVRSNHDSRFALPFYHLVGDGFWKLIPKPGFENILQLRASMRSFTNLNAAVDCAVIDDNLFLLIEDRMTNKILQQFLLDEYFPITKGNSGNSESEQQKLFDDIEGKILNEPAGEYRKEIKKLLSENNDEEIYIRGIVFKREIPKIYDNTCCISGMKINATVNISMIDACHIIPFSESYNDTVTNGIALCPNLHRAFDRGLIAIDDNYQIMVSSRFQEIESNYLIHIFKEKRINLPKENHHFPSKENLAWHRVNKFIN